MLVRFQTGAPIPDRPTGRTTVSETANARSSRAPGTEGNEWWPWCSGPARRAVNAQVRVRSPPVTQRFSSQGVGQWRSEFDSPRLHDWVSAPGRAVGLQSRRTAFESLLTRNPEGAAEWPATG